MFNLRLRQAQIAIKDGRLDAAYELVRDPSVREHRDGQRMVTELIDRFVARAAGHLDAGRLDTAESDWRKASLLGGRRHDVEQLRTSIDQAMRRRHDQRRKRDHAFHRVRKAVRAGRFERGLRMLDGMSHRSDSVCALSEEIEMQRETAEQQFAQAHRALKQGDLDEAIDRLIPLAASTGDHDRSDLIRQAVKDGIEKVRVDLTGGRLDRAVDLLKRLHRLGWPSGELDVLQRQVDDCLEAWQSVQRAEHRAALHLLQRVAADLPKAKWATEAIERLHRAAEDHDTLLTSPLAQLRHVNDEPATPTRGAKQTTFVQRPNDAPPPSAAKPASADTMILRIDGVGSYLVATSPTVTVGPISSPHRPTIGLVADPSLSVASIERNDEDYFLHHPTGIGVNGKKTTDHLLRHGDRIELSGRCRMKLLKPHTASSTALLHLSGARLPQGDVRHVVLLDRELIIADHAAAHVRTAGVRQPVTLVQRGGHLTCSSDATLRHGGAVAAGQPLPFDQGIEVGALTFTLSRS